MGDVVYLHCITFHWLYLGVHPLPQLDITHQLFSFAGYILFISVFQLVKVNGYF